MSDSQAKENGAADDGGELRKEYYSTFLASCEADSASELEGILESLRELPEGERKELLRALQLTIECLETREKIRSWILTLLAEAEKKHRRASLVLDVLYQERDRMLFETKSRTPRTSAADSSDRIQNGIILNEENIAQLKESLLKAEIEFELLKERVNEDKKS